MFRLVSRGDHNDIQYDALGASSSDSDIADPERKNSTDDVEGAYHERQSTLGLWAIIICILCTVINLVTLKFPINSTSPLCPDLSAAAKDINSLRRPSQFIGLDRIERPTPPTPKKFNNYPFLLTQIDASNPDNVYDDDPKRYLSRVGTISPEDRRVHVAGTVSTIVQFRAVDFGMENCELQLSVASSDPSLVLSPHRSIVSVFLLNATHPIDAKALSYKTRPPRISKIADVSLDYGSSWKRRFNCALDEVLSFEIACSSLNPEEGCSVEWWQNKDGPLSAVFLTQHSTV